MYTMYLSLSMIALIEANSSYETEYLEENCNKIIMFGSEPNGSALILKASESNVRSFARGCNITVAAKDAIDGLLISANGVGVDAVANDRKPTLLLGFNGLNATSLNQNETFYMDRRDAPAPRYFHVTLKLTSDHERNKGFEFVITGYKEQNPCFPDYFECISSRCIRDEYVCDKRNNCGNGEDEKNCVYSMEKHDVWMIALAFVLKAGLFFMIVALFIYARKRMNLKEHEPLLNWSTNYS